MGISDNFTHAVGRVTMNFGTLEFYLAFAISMHIDGDQGISMMLVNELSFRKRCEVLLSVFSGRVADRGSEDASTLIKEMSMIVGAAKTQEAERNRIVHSAWGTALEDDPDVAQRFKLGTKSLLGKSFEPEKVSAAGINALADQIGLTASRLISLLERVYPGHPAIRSQNAN